MGDVAMNLLYYEYKFSTLWHRMNSNIPGRRTPSPHMVALLLAVIDLIESNQIKDNRIYLNKLLRQRFRLRFQEFRQERDHPVIALPYFRLCDRKGDSFWHFKFLPGINKQDAYEDIKKHHSIKSINENIKYAFLDEELFKYLGYTFSRELLRTALLRNLFPEKRTFNLEQELWEWPRISSQWGILDNTPPPMSPNLQEAGRSDYSNSQNVDYEEQARMNSEKGFNGEKLVLVNEIIKLKQAGRDDLIADVEWTSLDKGDGEGFDIRSFRLPSATELYIEVKTTTGNDKTPFFISRNEVKFSKQNAKQYELHRVFNFSKNPGRFVLCGDVCNNNHILLSPTEYMAKVTAKNNPTSNSKCTKDNIP